MKPTELRIGNLIDYNKILHKIVSISLDLEDESVPFVDMIPFDRTGELVQHELEYIGAPEPIPLTEEWLFKLGFNEHKDDVYIKEWGTNGFEIITYHLGYQKYVYEIAKGKILLLNHVHQLQNLYFSLTGEELEVK